MKLSSKLPTTIWIVGMCFATPSGASETLRVLPDSINGVETRKMVRHYLLDQAEKAFLRREAAFEELKTTEQMGEHQRRMRDFLRAQLGDFPARTPLESRVVGRHQRDGYVVERVLYQSRPGHYISGSWRSLREAKRFYGRLGHPERVDLVEADVVHGFFRPLREGMARWMRRWLLGVDDPLREDDSPLLSEEEGVMQEFITAGGPNYSEFRPVRLPVVRSSPDGQVQLIPGAVSVF